MNLESHKIEQFWEDVEFLREQGMGDEQLARRLGVSRATLEKRRSRKENK